MDLNPAQHDLVLKVAELLCSKPEHDSRAEFWVEKAARLLPGYPAVFNLRVSVSSRRPLRCASVSHESSVAGEASERSERL